MHESEKTPNRCCCHITAWHRAKWLRLPHQMVISSSSKSIFVYLMVNGFLFFFFLLLLLGELLGLSARELSSKGGPRGIRRRSSLEGPIISL